MQCKEFRILSERGTEVVACLRLSKVTFGCFEVGGLKQRQERIRGWDEPLEALV